MSISSQKAIACLKSINRIFTRIEQAKKPLWTAKPSKLLAEFLPEDFGIDEHSRMLNELTRSKAKYYEHSRMFAQALVEERGVYPGDTVVLSMDYGGTQYAQVKGIYKGAAASISWRSVESLDIELENPIFYVDGNAFTPQEVKDHFMRMKGSSLHRVKYAVEELESWEDGKTGILFVLVPYPIYAHHRIEGLHCLTFDFLV